MKRFLCAILGVFLFLPASAWAIATISGSTTYLTQDQLYSNSIWTTGWGATDATGWDYVGSINGGSAVYLGGGYVLSVGHLSISGTSQFTLAGANYGIKAGSIVAITDTVTAKTADLVLFQITTDPNLLSLTLASSPPQISTAVMIGYGDGTVAHTSKSWGTSELFAEDSFVVGAWTTVDVVGASTTSKLVTGDSGGADFIYNNSTQKWELAGINELTGSGNGYYYSYMVDVNYYADEINAEIGAETVPEPSAWALMGTGGALFLWARRRKSALAQKAKISQI